MLARITGALLLTVAALGCRGEDDRRTAYERLPIISAPLDTVQALVVPDDTSDVEVDPALGTAPDMSSSRRAPADTLPDAEQLGYTRYSNPAYRYSIAYPDTLLDQGEPVGDGRGVEFHSRDGRVTMLVFAVENATREMLEDEYRTMMEDAELNKLYRVREENWFIVSGRKEDQAVYEKSVLEEGILRTFRIHYPMSEKEYFDAVTAVMATSFIRE